MMYWIVFALFTSVETVADIFASILPFYYEIKILFIFWLISPWTKGSTYLYRKCIHPTLSKKEQEIDEYINQASTRGYEALKRVGRNGMTLAANAVMTSAIKGQSSLLDQLKGYAGIAAIAAGTAGTEDQGGQEGEVRKSSLSQDQRREQFREEDLKLKMGRDETDDMGSLLTPDLHDLDYGESTHGDLVHSLDRLDNRLREEREQEQRQYIDTGDWGQKEIHHYQTQHYQPDNDNDNEWGEVVIPDKDLDYILGQQEVPQPKPRAKPRTSPQRRKPPTQSSMTTSLQQPHPPEDDSETSDADRPSLRRSTSLRAATRVGRYSSTENLSTTRGRYTSMENLTQRQAARRQEAIMAARSQRHSARQASKRIAAERRASDHLT